MPPTPTPTVRRQRPTTRATRSGISWESATARYLEECRRRNHSPATETIYSLWLSGGRITDFREAQGIVNVRQFTADSLRAFEVVLAAAVKPNGKPLSPNTIHQAHRVLKSFSGWCIAEGFMIDAAVLDVPGPELPDVHPPRITAAEERLILRAAAQQSARDAVLVEFMIRTGLRKSEVVNLQVDDLIEGPAGWYVRVRKGKGRGGGKDRLVPLDTPGRALSKTMVRYLERVRPRDTGQQALWLTLRRSRGDYQPLGANGLKMVFRHLGVRAGVHVHPHLMRHHFATTAISTGLNPMLLQKALGHRTLDMVQRYVNADEADLIEGFRQRRD